MKEKERRELSNTIMEHVMELGLKPYYTIFLANLILEKIENPTKGIDELVVVVNQLMPEKYRRGEVMQVSMQKNLQNLEEELHDCDKINQISKKGENLVSGLIIRNTVNYYVKKVLDEY